MSRHQPVNRRKLQAWMVFNAIILIGLTGWVLKVATVRQPGLLPPGSLPATRTSPQGLPSDVPLPTKDDILALPGTHFWLSAPQVPWSRSEIDGIADKAGARPTMLQFFVKWTQDFRAQSVTTSYQQGAIPVISWEPWEGVKRGENQPKYALSKIIRGDFDPYITKFATAVRDQRWPIAIRFAHEMNGHWYPWSERRSGNRKGQFVQAWRHVHDVFTRVGATNVIWVWSPNIIRPLPNVSIKDLYPGDAYVDWVGMVGYAVHEQNAGIVFEPTLKKLQQFTTRRVLITETGVGNGAFKARWITDFFRWLSLHPEVAGFIWFEFSRDQGATGDWRFTSTPESIQAFRAGATATRLATPPPGSGLP
jgi:hypothetical protein